jgi:hypothetical protein
MDAIQLIKTIYNSNIPTDKGFTKHEGAAPYKNSGWGSGFRIERGISLEEAKRIAQADDTIEYFFYTKARQMVLEISPEAFNDPNFNPIDSHNDPIGIVEHFSDLKGNNYYARIFHHGDVVFFNRADKWLGNAGPLADTYVKNR